MLEDCSDLAACENVLWMSTNNVEYLGEVDFVFWDIQKLSTLLKEGLAQAENGLEFLRGFPACISFYFVGKGIISYDRRNFWTLIRRELGIPDGFSQYKLVAIFLRFLRDKKLCDFTGEMSFVSGILLHGGIPLSYRKKFYIEAVKYLLEQGLVEECDIRREIYGLREQEKKRKGLSDSNRQLQVMCQTLQQEIDSLDNVIRFSQRRKELMDQVQARDGSPELDFFADLAGNFAEYRHALRRIPSAGADMDDCGRRLCSAVRDLAPKSGEDRLAEDMLWIVEREFFGTFIGMEAMGSGCPGVDDLDALAKDQPTLEGLVVAAERWRQRLLDLRAAGRQLQRHEQVLTKLMPAIANWETDLGQLTRTLHLRVAGPPETQIGELAERMAGALARESEVLRARYDLGREISPGLSLGRARRAAIGKEIASAGRMLRDLGDGDLDAGLRRLGDKHRALLELKEVGEGLETFKDSGFSFGLDEGFHFQEKLAQELRNIRSYLDLKEEQIELQAATAETAFWADLPDYSVFVAESSAELAEIEREERILRDKEREYSLKIDSFTSVDRRALELADDIERLVRGLESNRESHKKRDLLLTRVNGCTARMEALAAAIWPGGWDEAYTPVVDGLDLPAIEVARSEFIEAQKASREVEVLLGSVPVVHVRMGRELWAGALVFIVGPVLVLTEGAIGYPVALLGLVLLVTGLFRLKRAKAEKITQERKREGLTKEILAAGAASADKRQVLARLLEGLPLPPGSCSAGESWVDLLADLQRTSRERTAWNDELGRLEQGLGEWEADLRQVAAALPEPCAVASGGMVERLAERVIDAAWRRHDASDARAALARLLPDLRRVRDERAAVQASIAVVEQRFRDLGHGDPAAGHRELEKRKLAMTSLTVIDAELAGFKGLSPLPDWAEGVRLEEKLTVQMEDLKRYLEMKKEQHKLMEIVGDYAEWEQFADYSFFIASRNSELTVLIQTIAQLEEREARCLEVLNRLTSEDRLLIQKADSITALVRGLGPYTERKKQHEAQLRQIEKDRDEINRLVKELWSGGWEGGCLGSAGWNLDGFITQLTCLDRPEDLLGRFVDGVLAVEAAHGEYRLCDHRLRRSREVVENWERTWRQIAAMPLDSGLVEEKKQYFAELAEVEDRLTNCQESLSLPVDQLEQVLHLREERAGELVDCQDSLAQVAGEIPPYPSFLKAGPVQRFVLYGGERAVKWLHACVALHRWHLGERLDPQPVVSGLPDRERQGLDDLVKSIGEDEPKRGALSKPVRRLKAEKGLVEKFRNRQSNYAEQYPPPELILDSKLGELRLRVGGYRFRLHDASAKPEIHVRIAGEEWLKEERLPGYRHPSGVIKVPVKDYSLPVLASAYMVTLRTGTIERCWQPIKPFSDVPYLLFTDKGKGIEPNNLIQQKVWLVHPVDLAVDPAKAVINEGILSVAGQDFQMALIDLRVHSMVYLTSEGTRLHHIGVIPANPYLDKPDAGAWTKDGQQPVYVGEVPRLYVPYADDKEIKAWSIRVEGAWPDGAPERVVPGWEMADVGVGENGRLVVFLDEDRLLGRSPIGEYTVYLEHEDPVNSRRFDLALFPGLDFCFERLFHFPRQGDGDLIRLDVIVPEHLKQVLRVEAREPARLLGLDGDEVHIGIGALCDCIDLELVYTAGGRSCRTPVTVEVPKVWWRLRSKVDPVQVEWHDDVTELWHEDCCGADNARLEVKVAGSGHPRPEVKQSRVVLDDEGHEVKGNEKNGIWEFDLAGLADSLRGGKDVYGLALIVEDSRGRPLQHGTGKLLAIRSRWRVTDFRYEVAESREGRTLRASWTDLGRPGSRVSRLWRMAEPWESPVELPVVDGAKSLEHCFIGAELAPGSYLLNFADYDAWGGEGKFPRVKTNCAEIEVRDAETHVIVDECRWAGEKSLMVSGTVVNAGGSVETALGLFGFVKGSPRDWWERTSTDENGHFSLLMRNLWDKSLQKSDWITTESARPHWLGVVVDGTEPVYHFEIIPDPGGVWWPFGSGAALRGMEGLGCGRLFIDCRDKRLDQPFLNQEASALFLHDMSKGHSSAKLEMRVSGVSKEIDLMVTGNLHEAVMKIDAMVCTSCGAIVPDQDIWDREHYFSKLQCKSYNYKRIPHTVFLYWYWDTSPYLATLEEKYALAGRRPLTLYDSLTRPLPDLVRGDQTRSGLWFDLEKLVAALWEREAALLMAAGR